MSGVRLPNGSLPAFIARIASALKPRGAQRATAFTLTLLMLCVSIIGTPMTANASPDPDVPIRIPGTQPINAEKLGEQDRVERDLAFVTRRLAGDNKLDEQQAASLRSAAADWAKRLKKDGAPAAGPATFTAAWAGIGPDPIVQVSRAPDGGGYYAVSGRIGALAIRKSTGQFILGAAQGGIWLYDTASGTWMPKADDLGTLSIGALAIAPSNDAIVYAGSGEGALSGDSYFGNGVMKSTDGGQTWAHVSGDFFQSISVSRLVVDPNNANHLYAAVLRGRGGARRTSPALHSRFGIWESTDGAANWTLLKEMPEANGATDLEIDPLNPQILYASFWGDAIYKSTNAGHTWSPIMAGLPVGNFNVDGTRFSISLSHPAGKPAVLYVGFDWSDAAGHHPSRLFKSTNEGALWTELIPSATSDNVLDYCGGQCSYDNVIEADPTNPNIVFAAGQFDYGIGSGGIFRSDDGGITWKDLGWDQHPDFHALAFDPSNTARVLIGSDGGVWTSGDRGGRPTMDSPLDAVTWENLNGTVNRDTAAVIHKTGLQIAQFTSIATTPQTALRFWGGTQDNGTGRKSSGSSTWFDLYSGDGGQVLVDPNLSCSFGAPNSCFVYGTYFGISPYRAGDGGANFFNNFFIRNGINRNDRSDFYTPFVMNKANPDQLFLGTYRLYRTNNARTTKPGDVLWKPISPDLTSGCTGTAPNGARNCTISAIGVGGGQAVYTGSLDGLIYLSTDAQTSDNPTWKKVSGKGLPNRPVTQITVDPSNYRIAYASYAGFDAATRKQPGHLFRTTDGGDTWTNITGNLPDSPVNSVILDPSYANTLYAGTDVGPFTTTDGGFHWSALGTGFPIVAIWQLDLDPARRVLAAGTHGRGAFKIADSAANAAPALVLSKVDAHKPVGPSSNIDYTLTLKNIGNAAATGVKLTDPIPGNTTFVSAGDGGVYAGTNNNGNGNNDGNDSEGTVTWSNLSIPAGGSINVHMTVNIDKALKKKITSITNDGMKATSAQGPSTTGSPFVTPIAPPYGVAVTPATQTDGGRGNTSVQYTVALQNLGYTPDSYKTSATSTYAVTFYDGATCSTPLTTTPTVAPGATTNVCAKVAIPAGAANGATNTATITATSVGSPTVKATATLKTIAVAVDTLLVDGDGNGPDVQSYYTAALTGAGATFSTWDLATDSNLPGNYMKAFKNIVWFTGNAYPSPITPYETRLQAFLDNGGRLLMSGQDILDQAAGRTAFVANYLHITWDGTEVQNDKATAQVHGVAGSPISGTPLIGAVTLDHSVLAAAFEDRITPNGGAIAAFTDNSTATDALSFSGTNGTTTVVYKVVFLAFPFEAYSDHALGGADRTDLMKRVLTFFGS